MKPAWSLILTLVMASVVAESEFAAAGSRQGIVGRWAGRTPSPGDAGGIVVVAFKADFSADVTVEPARLGAPAGQRGRWEASNGWVSLQLLANDGAPSGAPLRWRKRGTTLLPEGDRGTGAESVGVALVRMGKAGRAMRYEGMAASPLVAGDRFAECWTGLDLLLAGVAVREPSTGTIGAPHGTPAAPVFTEVEGHVELQAGSPAAGPQLVLVVSRAVHSDPARSCVSNATR